ncbi:hypothetical protein HQ32_00369 [Prauserella sp. Am3]|nr:hypothetical protein HQ32_00369 [Prauserella sp. Am3]
MSAEFDRLVAEFEKFQSRLKRVDEQMAGVADMQSELSELEATASNSDRSVTVVAGPGGSVKDIQLTDKAMTQPPQALAAAIKSTLYEAVAEAARKQAGIVDTHMGGLGMNVTDQVIETQAEAFGISKEELRQRMAEEQPARESVPVEEEYHEDYSHQSVFDGDGDDNAPAPTPPASGSASSGDEFLKSLFNDEEERR